MDQKIAIIGGSRREQIICDHLKAKGFNIHSFATETDGETTSSSLTECLCDADVLILPVRSNHKEMLIEGTSTNCPIQINKEILGYLKNSAVIYCGAASEGLRNLACETDHRLIEIMEDDLVAIPNADLTAEGTLRHIMDYTSVSLNDTRIAVLGYGRVGRSCAKLFLKAGCDVTVFCRSEKDIRHGRENGLDMRYIFGAPSVLRKVNVLVNTIPALVVDETMLSYLRKDCRIIDLASIPGGVDFEAASRMGLSAELLPGVPGKYAPITAGKILASYYEYNLRYLNGGDLF
ncbi:MAG: hypothetical protein IJC82_04520 [Firmicutes bacterium]|nr:hypothetical protein [Bacillota bacterium]